MPINFDCIRFNFGWTNLAKQNKFATVYPQVERRRQVRLGSWPLAVNHFLLAAACAGWLTGCTSAPPPTKPDKPTWSSFDQPSDHLQPDKFPPGGINLEGVQLAVVLKIYAAISGRTIITGQLPTTMISIHNQTPMSRIETLQMLDTLLAQNGVAMVLSGDKSVKAVPIERAAVESPPEIDLPWPLLPDSSSCMTRTVRVQHFKPSEAVPVLVPLSHLPNSIIPIDEQGILILRDFSGNIRQELKLLETLDKQAERRGG